MPNAIIAVGMVIIIGSAHQHHRPLREVEDKVAVNGIIVDDVGDKEEDAVGGSWIPRSTNACCSDNVGIRGACT